MPPGLRQAISRLPTLDPGAYTAVLTNGDGATATTLVEAYEMGFESLEALTRKGSAR